MNVFHTSDVCVAHPDISYSRDYLDFGKGFYVTPLRTQAEKYAARILVRGKKPVLNSYELCFDKQTIRYKCFESYNEEWLEYVAACRDGRAVIPYDVIEGGVADDKVFDTVDLYFSGLMSKTDALRRLIYVEPNWQICIASQRVLDENLLFVKSEMLVL